MMRVRILPWLGSLFILSVLGCSDEPAPGPASFVLEDGVTVDVAEDGSVSLALAGRQLWATAPGFAPTARSFEAEVNGGAAIFSFGRSSESVHSMSRYRRREQLADGSVEVAYAGGGRSGVLRLAPDGPNATRATFELTSGSADSLALPLRCDPGGSFHGFGEQFNATDQRGEAFDLWVGEQGLGRDGTIRPITGDAHTTYFPMPYYLDARGFGVLIRTHRRVLVDVCASDAEVAWIEEEGSASVEFAILHGPTPLDVIEQLADEVGRPAALPDWAFSPWIGIQGGSQAVRDEADALELAGVPFGALWAQDWTGERMNIDGGFGVQYRWVEDAARYPDLTGLVTELHGRGYRFLAYANPFVDAALTDHFPAMDAGGWLLGDPEGGSYTFFAPNGRSAHPDLTSAAARDYVKTYLRAMVQTTGMDGWMVDFGEWSPIDAVYSDGSDPIEAHNRYPEMWQRLNREVMEEVRPDGDWVLFSRSGHIGAQGAGQIHWVGDQEVDFSPTDGLPTVIPALLNLGLAAVPYVTLDIGGFSGGPRTKEAFMRWTELGAFTPIMRTHEGNASDVNWDWDSDAETTAHFGRFARIHVALEADFQAAAQEAEISSAPILRHLMLEFPEDRQTWSIDDQFMIGDSLLVAPVVEEGATSRDVYLPAGTWYDVWTGDVHAGPTTVTMAAPIGAPPVFSRGVDRTDLRAVP